MYAVIKTGGKQQKVKPGDIIEVEYLHVDGETVTFQPVLVVDDEGNTHYGKEAQQAVVTAKLLGEQKGDKVHVFKYKNKSGYARRQGHRQLMTLLEISDVKLGSGRKRSPAKQPAEPAAEAAATKGAATKAAATKAAATKAAATKGAADPESAE